jgi:hypothetical protein
MDKETKQVVAGIILTIGIFALSLYIRFKH